MLQVNFLDQWIEAMDQNKGNVFLKQKITKLLLSDESDLVLAMIESSSESVSLALSRLPGVSKNAAWLLAHYFHPDCPGKKGRRYDSIWFSRAFIELDLFLMVRESEALEKWEQILGMSTEDTKQYRDHLLRGLSVKRIAEDGISISKSNFRKVIQQSEKITEPAWIEKHLDVVSNQPPWDALIVRDNLSYDDALWMLKRKYNVGSIETLLLVLDLDQYANWLNRAIGELADRLAQVVLSKKQSDTSPPSIFSVLLKK